MKMFKYVLFPLLAVCLAGCSLFNSGEDEKYNPQNFPAAPGDAPFSISVDYEQIQQQGKPMLKLKLNIHNKKSSPLGLSTAAYSSGGFFKQFIITGADTSFIWEMYTANTIAAVGGQFVLDAGETKTISYNWDYLKDGMATIPRKKFLLFGGLYGLGVYEDTTFTERAVNRFEKIGVGNQPVTIDVGQ